MYPYQRLKEEGYDVHIAAPSKKKLHFVVHDFEPGYDTYTEKPGYSWDADVAFADVNPADYSALVIPGGRAPEYIRNNSDCQNIVGHFFGQQEPVAQLCHAGLVLAACGVLKGRQHESSPGQESRMELRVAEEIVEGFLPSLELWEPRTGPSCNFSRRTFSVPVRREAVSIS